MKLKLKYLASYLPYGLNIKDVKHGSVFEALPFITTPHQDFSLFKGNFDQLINDKYLKPILFPLSSLTKDEMKNITKSDFNRYSEDYLDTILNTMKREINSKKLPYYLMEKLFERKFDVFGLIELGLAEPVTEDFNPYKQTI